MKRPASKPLKALLILVIVALLAGTGWFVWQTGKNTDTNNAASDQPQNSSQNQNNQNNSDQANTIQPSVKYLEIPQWGIKFTLSPTIADAYYDNVTSSSLDSFSLRDHSLDSEPDCTTGSQSVVTIFRVSINEPDDVQPEKKYSETRAEQGQIIGDYFYFVQGAQYSCAEDPASNATLIAVRAAFIDAGSTIQKL